MKNFIKAKQNFSHNFVIDAWTRKWYGFYINM